MAKQKKQDQPSFSNSIDDPMNYVNREMSMLNFQRRVLFEAMNPSNPLLERLRFLGLLGSIFDEFFMVRVGSLTLREKSKKDVFYFENLSPEKQLREIRKEAQKLFQDAQECFFDTLKPLLSDAGIKIFHYADLNKAQRSRVDAYYKEIIFPVLTPLAFDPGHPFPYISNSSFNLAIIVEDKKGKRHFARLKVPGSLPYFLPVHKAAYDASPRAKRVRKFDFVWISDVIMANLQDLFPGMKVLEVHPFRVLRNAEVELQDLEVMDLLEVMEESVRRRRFGAVVRLLIDKRMPDRVLKILVDNMRIDPQFIYTYNDPVILHHLLQITQVDRPDLKFEPFTPMIPREFRMEHDSTAEQFFNLIRQKEIMLHHPYDSFKPVEDFLYYAAIDPDVLAIKQTLYRVGRNSPVVRTLLQARRDYGKQVAVLVELKARFDEESNIEWAKLLEKEGVHVTYGLLGLKTHSKIALVVRKEGEHIRRYVHMATGNYNHITAQLYEDIGMFTCDDDIGADATDIFNYLTGYSSKEKYRKLLVAPLQLRDKFQELIHQEIAHHKKHKDGRIILKMNALEDEEMIRMLYRASKAGVKIDLIVRGICCLRPAIEGLSDNIRVISVVGRFLEHSRVYYFYNHGQEIILMGSADLMPRNLNQRVEVLFPVESEEMIRHLRDDVLEIYLQGNIKAWTMQPDGNYQHAKPSEGGELIDIQRWFLNKR